MKGSNSHASIALWCARLAVACCFMLLIAPGLCWLMVNPGSEPLVQGTLVPLLLLTVYVAVWGRRLWLGLLLLIPFVALAPFEAALIVTYRHPLDHTLLATVFESNWREVHDYLGAALWPVILTGIAALAAPILATLLAQRLRMTWTGKARQLVLLGSGMMIVALALPPFLVASGSVAQRVHNTYRQLWDHGTMLKGGYPFGVFLNAMDYYTNWHAMRNEVSRLAGFRFGARAATITKQRQIYVLVIGESSRRDHWSLFGYARPTNPRLSALSNIVPIGNMVTPWNASRMAIPILLTRKPATDKSDFFSEASIVRAFSEAGYATYWLSNQLAVGLHDSPISAYAYEAGEVRFFNPASWLDRGTYDEVLVAALSETIARSSQNLFIVLHTMGSHMAYRNRYPSQFDIFRPSSADGTKETADARVLNAYDNSILYTDYVLSEVVATLKETKAVAAMFYASDHGEEIPNHVCHLFGHGYPNLPEYLVPALFWYSDAYAAVFPERMRRLRDNAQKPVSTESVFDTLIDLGNIALPSRDANRSLLSDEFRERRRIVNASGLIDIDEADIEQPCEHLVPRSLSKPTKAESP